MKYKVAFITGCPNWHRPELYRLMASHPKIDLMMYFCLPEKSADIAFRQGFRTNNQNLRANLLKGYRYKFLKNYSPFQPVFNRTKFFSCLNFGVWKEIKKGGYDAVVIGLWNAATYWIAALACKSSDTPILFAGDSTILTEQKKHKWKRGLKQLLLQRLLFPMSSAFLCTGNLNRQFYNYYGVPEDKMFFFPQSVNYNSYTALSRELQLKKDKLRRSLGISEDKVVVLFVGRLAPEKQPLDLLKAHTSTNRDDRVIVIVGSGLLRGQLQDFVNQQQLKNVYLIGFQSKEKVLTHYAMSDILVLPSSFEPHSAVVKEAMCFGLPVIVSDKVGAAADIIEHDRNGFVYPCGDTGELASYIDILVENSEKRKMFGEASLEIIKDWDHQRAINGLIEALDWIYEGKET